MYRLLFCFAKDTFNILNISLNAVWLSLGLLRCARKVVVRIFCFLELTLGEFFYQLPPLWGGAGSPIYGAVF